LSDNTPSPLLDPIRPFHAGPLQIAQPNQPGQTQGKVSDEAFAKMTPRERLDYARGFDQRQFLEHGRRWGDDGKRIIKK
jgi:hypothetical protein